MGKVFWEVVLCRDEPEKSMETKQESKHKKTTILQKDGRKQGQEDYPTYVTLHISLH